MQTVTYIRPALAECALARKFLLEQLDTLGVIDPRSTAEQGEICRQLNETIGLYLQAEEDERIPTQKAARARLRTHLSVIASYRDNDPATLLLCALFYTLVRRYLEAQS
jgi:hypothetical protein